MGKVHRQSGEAEIGQPQRIAEDGFTSYYVTVVQ